MKAFNNQLQLGNGVYGIPDLAFILQLAPKKVSRWLNDFWDDRLAKEYQGKYSWGKGRDKATSFHTLIEFYVFYQLRAAKVSVSTILKAHQAMAKQLKTPHPFASSRVLTDGRNILYSLEDGTTLKADASLQIAFREIIESFCRKIEFSDDLLAEKFYPLGKDHHVVVDPHHQFGQPVIIDTNVLAQTLYELYEAGDSAELIARLYDISVEEVNDAVALFNLKSAA